MTDADARKIYEKLLSFGENVQLRQVQEEAAELVVAISHHLRGVPGGTGELIEEIADMEIMMDQIRIMFGHEPMAGAIKKCKRTKLRKLADFVGLEIG